MKQYQCHKKVHAAKIHEIDLLPQSAVLKFESDPWIEVSGAYVNKHNPQVGGYYVLYEDGYESYSPAEAFESGYIEISQVIKIS